LETPNRSMPSRRRTASTQYRAAVGFAAMATGAVAAGILVILAVVALGGNDYDRCSNAVRTTMPAGMSDAPRRLPNGTAFVAKPTQRLLEVRTAAAERETVRPPVNLIGGVRT
jgi:hypothetical protein